MTIFYNKRSGPPVRGGSAVWNSFGTMTDEKGETFFVGKDVAEVLGYTAPRNAIAAHVEGDDKKDALIQGSLGGPQKMTVPRMGCCGWALAPRMLSLRTFGVQ